MGKSPKPDSQNNPIPTWLQDFADQHGAVVTAHVTPSLPQSEQRSKGYRLYADAQLVARSVRQHAQRELWLWQIARFLDAKGAGRVFVADLLKIAQKLDPSLTKAEFDKYLRRGEKAGFWTCSRQAYRGETETAYRRKLFYTAETKLALAGAGQDGTNWPGTPKVEIPLRWGKYLPFAYAAWFRVLIDEKTRSRMLVDGTRKRSKQLKVVSISRAVIQAVWGISPHTQIKWEKIAGVVVKHSRVQADEKTHWSDIPADYAWPYLTNDGKEQWMWDGVNSYTPPKLKVSKSKRTRLKMRRQYRAKVGGVDSDAQPLSILEQPADGQQPAAGQGTQRPFETIYHDYGKAKDGFEAVKKIESGRQKRRPTKEPMPPRKQQVTLGSRGIMAVRQQVTNRPVQTTPLIGIDYQRMNSIAWSERRSNLIEWMHQHHANNA
jgi:hypothetical protein